MDYHLIPKPTTAHDPESVPSDSHAHNLFPLDPSYKLTNSLVAEHNGSTPLIPKSTTAHDPESVPSTSHPHSLFP